MRRDRWAPEGKWIKAPNADALARIRASYVDRRTYTLVWVYASFDAWGFTANYTDIISRITVARTREDCVKKYNESSHAYYVYGKPSKVKLIRL